MAPLRAVAMAASLAHALALPPALALVGCAAAEDGVDAGPRADAEVDAGPDSGAPRCCAVDLVPDTPCGCVRIGGATPSDGVCPTRCAVNGADFDLASDEQGCLFNTIPAQSTCEVPDGG